MYGIDTEETGLCLDFYGLFKYAKIIAVSQTIKISGRGNQLILYAMANALC